MYAKKAGYGLQAQNICAEIRIRYERRCGRLLKEMPMAKPGPKAKDTYHDGRELPTLSEMGVSIKGSGRQPEAVHLVKPYFCFLALCIRRTFSKPFSIKKFAFSTLLISVGFLMFGCISQNSS